jgi:hypothetical protein
MNRIFFTADEAIAMLPDGETVHTFRSGVGILIGADWDRDDLIRAIRANKCEQGGEQCTAMGHGLVVWTSETNPLFVETRK